MVVPMHDVEFIPSTPTLMRRRGRLEDSTHVFGKMGRLGPRMKELGCSPGTLVPGEADEEVQGSAGRRDRRPGRELGDEMLAVVGQEGNGIKAAVTVTSHQ